MTSNLGYGSRHSERRQAAIALLSATIGVVVLLADAVLVDLMAAGLRGPGLVEVLEIVLIPLIALVAAMTGFYFARRESSDS